MCENEYNDEDSNEIGLNKSSVTCKNQQSEKTAYTSNEELAVLLQEKLQIHEKEKELKMLVSNLQNTEKYEKNVADLIRSRFGDLYFHCKKFEGYFECLMNIKRNNIQSSRMLCGKVEVVMEQKLAIAESMFASFNEQISTIELLMRPDCDILCHEQEDCFSIIARECNKLEEVCNKFMSVILEL